MTLIAVALAAVLLVVVIVAGEAIRRALRSSERRERALMTLVKEGNEYHRDVLDRVLYAAGKPWKDTADRPEPDEPEPLDFDHITEDPVPGGAYAGDALYDELEMRSPNGDSVFIPDTFVADMERQRVEYDTAELEVT